MVPTRILVLGGYGGAGKALIPLLLQETEASIVIGGRRKERAEEYAESLRRLFSNRSFECVEVDAAHDGSVVRALQGVDLVVVAAPVSGMVQHLAEVVIGEGVDWIDLMFDRTVVGSLKVLEQEILAKHRLFITQAGFHPGMAAVLVRAMAPSFTEMHFARVAMAMNARFPTPDSTREIIEASRDFDVDLFTDGRWRKATYDDVVTVDFGSPFGRKKCWPLRLEELRAMPDDFPLREIGAYVAGFNWFVDYLVFPLIMGLHKIKPGFGDRLLQYLLYWGTNTFSRRELCVVMQAVGEGMESDRKKSVLLRLEHSDPYYFTVAPVVSCINQYVEGNLPERGLQMMGHVVDPKRTLHDLARLGIRIDRVESDR
ncbi:MAG: KR domain-containing protein [Ignavibacteria bacterium]|nr:KR domain-containing protein [Ignavibacteria bacterium]